MIDKSAFAQLQKQSSKSFHDQKALIKKVLAGRAVTCKECKQPLIWHELSNDNKTAAKISCQKGCTDIALELE